MLFQSLFDELETLAIRLKWPPTTWSKWELLQSEGVLTSRISNGTITRRSEWLRILPLCERRWESIRSAMLLLRKEFEMPSVNLPNFKVLRPQHKHHRRLPVVSRILLTLRCSLGHFLFWFMCVGSTPQLSDYFICKIIMLSHCYRPYKGQFFTWCVLNLYR